jgi:hypothetical protein
MFPALLLLLLLLVATVSNLAAPEKTTNLASLGSLRASKFGPRSLRRLRALQRCLTLSATPSCHALPAWRKS